LIQLYTYYPKYAVRPIGRETRHLGSAFRNGSTGCNILEAKMMPRDPDVILAADDQMQFLRGAPNLAELHDERRRAAPRRNRQAFMRLL
jgi:hypothetical protein